ncbi:MAG: NAD(P)/FAD-dependent oxidoreductase, partial [Clostridiaceae bacterium]|nr:NAD(P)/FAD-dependent oxidoreductase [Clostridiaceae bacterium]
MEVRYDIAIIGSGPAGLSAAINSKIRNKNVIVFGSKDLSNKMLKAPVVNNYLGFPEATGEELKDSFQKHIDNLKIQIKP